MYERFTDDARKVMQLATQTAQHLRHDYIGTEHILLGLVKFGSGGAATVLKNRNLKLNRIRLEVEKLLRSGPDITLMGTLPKTPNATEVIEHAMEEARNLSSKVVDTEHLLLGLLRVKDTVGYDVLTKFDLEIEQLRQEVRCLHAPENSGKSNATNDSPRVPQTPAIDSFTRDITELVRGNMLTTVVGRQKEIDRLTTLLCRRDRHNAILVGESGSGRRSIVHGLAQRIVNNTITQSVVDHRIVSLDQGYLVAGTKYRGQFEERVKALVNEMRRSKNIILFVPQIHTLGRLGLVDDSGLTAFEMLKHAMVGETGIKCVGTCTQAEYDEHIADDSDLQRLFQVIPVAPPSKTETLEILEEIKPVYEAFHNVEIRNEAVKAAVELGDTWLPDGVMPEKAIRLIDEASAKLGVDIHPPDQSETKRKIATLVKQKEDAISQQHFDKAAKLRDEVNTLMKQIDSAMAKWKSDTGSFGSVDVQDIVTAVSLETGTSEQDIVDKQNTPQQQNPDDQQ